jgi:hypothetical protein
VNGSSPSPSPALQPSSCGTVVENAALKLDCGAGHQITSVSFASYGTPTGNCTSGFHSDASCNAAASTATVQSLCVGHQSCAVTASNDVFGGDPCHLTAKHLSASVQCSKAQDDDGGGGDLHDNAVADDQPVLRAWRVRYPWREGDAKFNSSVPGLNDVWDLCENTLRVTSLDTYTDSNTRERRPYEADGYITASSRYLCVCCGRKRMGGKQEARWLERVSASGSKGLGLFCVDQHPTPN